MASYHKNSWSVEAAIWLFWINISFCKFETRLWDIILYIYHRLSKFHGCIWYGHMWLCTLLNKYNDKTSVRFALTKNTPYLTLTVSLAFRQLCKEKLPRYIESALYPLRWRHNGCNDVSNHQPLDCLFNLLFRRRSNETSNLRVTGLCAGSSPGTGEFPAQMASNAENVSIWWRHHAVTYPGLSISRANKGVGGHSDVIGCNLFQMELTYIRHLFFIHAVTELRCLERYY